MDRPPALAFQAETMCDPKTRQAMVWLKIDDLEVGILTQSAREIATMLMDVAHASEADAFLFEFVADAPAGSELAGIKLLKSFRDWRIAHLRKTRAQSEENGHV